jgi:signal recognition particle receptor subunit beta
MVFFNWATMQMAAKIVYYGPGLCGKTSNLSYIYAKTSPNSRGEMVSLETESDRTLFFDLLPIEVGTIGGFKTRLQLYTVPGQVFYNTTRKLVLKGVDGLVFVADSQRPMREANIESFESLIDNLTELGLELRDLPLVLQYNKRDLKNVLAVEELNNDLNVDRAYSFFEAEAINGLGVFETLKEITKLTLKKLRKRMVAPHAAGATARAPGVPARPQIAAPRRPTSVSAARLAQAAEEGVGAAADPMPVERPSTSAVEPPAELAVAADPPAGDLPGDGASPFGESTDGGSMPDFEQPFPIDEGAGKAPAVAAAPVAVATEAPSVAAEPERRPLGEETEVSVEFDKTDSDLEVAPPPVKRVQVSNQMDILAELEGLRKQATMGAGGRWARPADEDVDIESLLAGSDPVRELRERVQETLNSDIFKNMRGVQVAVRIHNQDGETIHALDPVNVEVVRAGKLERLSLRFTIDLENKQ